MLKLVMLVVTVEPETTPCDTVACLHHSWQWLGSSYCARSVVR